MSYSPSLAKVIAAVTGSLDDEWQDFGAPVVNQAAAEAAATSLNNQSVLWTYAVFPHGVRWAVKRRPRDV